MMHKIQNDEAKLDTHYIFLPVEPEIFIGF